MTAWPRILPILALALLTAGGEVQASATDGRCWADWSAAAPVVHREALRSARDVRALAQARRADQLLTITLCEDAGRFVYRLLFLKTAGTLESITVDARRPFEP